MKTAYFSARYLNSLHRKAREVWQELPAKEGWQKSKADPMDILKIFPGIQIRKGFVLRAYVFRSGLNGNGVVWAMSEDSHFPEPDECERLDNILKSPKPCNALPVTEVVEGDDSPLSYISASIFVREMLEFGAHWHGEGWNYHEIVGRRRKEWRDLEWFEDVKDLRPRVIMGEKVTVEFYTYSKYISKAVYRHVDVYSGYRFESKQDIVAQREWGFIP